MLGVGLLTWEVVGKGSLYKAKEREVGMEDILARRSRLVCAGGAGRGSQRELWGMGQVPAWPLPFKHVSVGIIHFCWCPGTC